MIRWPGVVRILLILTVLLAAVVMPIISSGYIEWGRAQKALQVKDYATAAQQFESASWKLPWRHQLLEEAAMAMAHVDPEAAIALFEKVGERGSLSAEGWDTYGSMYWSTSKDDGALKVWLAGLQHYPSYERFYYLISLAYRQMHDFTAQEHWLDKWLQTHKGFAFDHYELGQLLMISDPARARNELELSASMDPASASAVATLEACLDIAARATDDSTRLVILGRGLGLVNNWPLAEHVFEQAMNVDRQNPEAWAWLGEARQQNSQDGKAELDKALALDPKNTLVRALRGMYWKRQQEYSAELAEYERAARLEPKNAEWQAALGGAYTSRGDLVSALVAYQKATSLAPTAATYWRLLAMFCADNGVQVAEIGLPAARKAAELDPGNADVLDALGWAYAQAGLLYNAEQTLIKAAEIAPGSGAVHLHLAQTHLLRGDQVAARRELLAASQLDPNGAAGALAARLLKQYFP